MGKEKEGNKTKAGNEYLSRRSHFFHSLLLFVRESEVQAGLIFCMNNYITIRYAMKCDEMQCNAMKCDGKSNIAFEKIDGARGCKNEVNWVRFNSIDLFFLLFFPCFFFFVKRAVNDTHHSTRILPQSPKKPPPNPTNSSGSSPASSTATFTTET